MTGDEGIAGVYEELRAKGFTLEVGPEGCAVCDMLPGRYHEYTCSVFDPPKRVPLLTKEELDTRVQEMVDILKPPPRRLLAYMMHPLGNGTNREYNRKMACIWQATIQEAHPEWLVLAPWIGLSGAWSEARRELGMQTDFATIDVCDLGIIAGPLDGPKNFIDGSRSYTGVSPGMADELQYFSKFRQKGVLDLREQFRHIVEQQKPPVVETSPRVVVPPRFKVHEYVHVENKQGGVCRVKLVEQPATNCYRYLIERTETFFAHEQALVKAEPPLT